MRRLHVAAFLTLAVTSVHPAQSDEFHISNAEKAACTGDAERLCFSSYPDERKLLACFHENIASLSPQCATVFKAGLKSRGLHR